MQSNDEELNSSSHIKPQGKESWRKIIAEWEKSGDTQKIFCD